jgi:hypothetical protein
MPSPVSFAQAARTVHTDCEGSPSPPLQVGWRQTPSGPNLAAILQGAAHHAQPLPSHPPGYVWYYIGAYEAAQLHLCTAQQVGTPALPQHAPTPKPLTRVDTTPGDSRAYPGRSSPLAVIGHLVLMTPTSPARAAAAHKVTNSTATFSAHKRPAA